MAVKKFLMTFSIIVFCFLIGAGVVLIQVINNADAKALAEAEENLEQGLDIIDKTEENNDSYLDEYLDIKPFNALLLVRDKVGASTDAIMLVNIDTINSKISIMSIPRDTVISTDINNNNENDDIINMVYASKSLDIDKTIEYIGNELNCNIKYGAVMKLKVFRDIIDQLGKVTFEVPYHMEYDDPYQALHIYFEKGLHQFNGEDAEKLLRHRQNNEGVESTFVNGSDIQRIQTQQNFIKALVDQKLKLFYASKINNIINIIFDNLDTNVTTNDISRMLPEILKIDLQKIEWFTLPTDDDENFIHLIPDKDKIRDIINSNFKGVSN